LPFALFALADDGVADVSSARQMRYFTSTLLAYTTIGSLLL
jgi:hypothetical protein